VSSYLTSDESQTLVGPLNQISLHEAYIILGIEGNKNLEDADVMAAYTDLVIPPPFEINLDWLATRPRRLEEGGGSNC